MTRTDLLFAATACLALVAGQLQAQEPANKELPKNINDQVQDTLNELFKQLGQAIPGAAQPKVAGRAGRLGAPNDPRLGVGIERPSAVLVDQLDLPRNQGMVVREIIANSAAAKAGIKANDILLELNGKPVPADENDFAKFVDDIKANTPVDAVVLRKGKKETVPGLSLPEADPNARNRANINRNLNNLNIVRNIQVMPLVRGGKGAQGGQGGLAAGMNVEKTGDGGFKIRYTEEEVTIIITGKAADGQTTVSEIEIKDGTSTRKYENVEQVPNPYRDAVKSLLKQSEKAVLK